MDHLTAREALDRLIVQRHERYEALSRLIGRNPAYIQQYIKRGTPKKLDADDRRVLARYFGVNERLLGGPDHAPDPGSSKGALSQVVKVPRLALGASAGAGSLDEDERAVGALAFDTAWLRAIGVKGGDLSIIRVDGESMAPTLNDGDEIMVDGADGPDRLRDGIYVLRLDDVLMVKRVAMGPQRGRFSVRSDNSHYPTWDDIDPALVGIVGRVVWAGRRVS
ncbi:MAG: S24 family peptidase [Sphingobium sp.]